MSGEKSVILFGAGRYGKMALTELGEENVEYFVDNDIHKQGSEIEGKKIYPLCHLEQVKETKTVMICGMSHITMERQLIEMGVKNFKLFEPQVHYYPTSEIVYNPYEDKEILEDEGLWIEEIEKNKIVEYVTEEVDFLKKQERMFSHIEIETINRCNGNCSFCPVSARRDVRKPCTMSDELFKKIIEELAGIDYSGRLALFSNNEPFLDPHIIERNKYARERLPKAKMHLFTNGTLLTVDKFKGIIDSLDELIIDNYSQKLQLSRTSQDIVNYCEIHPELKKKVTIVLRKSQEVLTTRGGEAPNRKIKKCYYGAKCTLPFKQMIIRPDGKISLCCNDALGKMTLGDLNQQGIVEAWFSDEYKNVRKLIEQGRENISLCKYCDYFAIG